jgi:Phosphotransferase enzyme family
VQNFIDSLDFEYLSRLAQSTRSLQDSTAKVHRNVFSVGRERIAFQIEFSDGVSWIARISLPPLPTAQDDDIPLPCPGTAVMLSETVTMRLVANKTSIPIPKIHAYDFENNCLGAPYMLMDEVLGNFIRPFPSTPIENIPKIYGQVADIVLELATITFPKIGMISADNSNHDVTHCLFEDFTVHPAFSSATVYYTSRFGQFLEEKKSEIPVNLDWVTFAWLCVQSIPHFVISELENGPFPLHHPDLNNGNILYDDNEGIVGVLDWTASGTFPWETAVAPPMDLAVGYFDSRREMYIDVFEVKERERTGCNRLTRFMRSPAAVIVNLVTDNHRSWGKIFPDHRALRLARLVYGDGTTWEDVKDKYSRQCN